MHCFLPAMARVVTNRVPKLDRIVSKGRLARVASGSRRQGLPECRTCQNAKIAPALLGDLTHSDGIGGVNIRNAPDEFSTVIRNQQRPVQFDSHTHWAPIDVLIGGIRHESRKK